MKKRLQDFEAKRCETAWGWLLRKNKVLLVKHKMLGMWLAPGGHLEKNELPHQAAEREFFEETGVKVQAISAYPLLKTTSTEALPMPFTSNLHWINKPGEKAHVRDTGDTCEQHYGWGYFMKVTGDIKLNDSDTGIDEVRWFSESEIDALQTNDVIKAEAHFVFARYPGE